MRPSRTHDRRGAALRTLLASALLAAPAAARAPDPVHDYFPALAARPLGPAVMGGRITCVAATPGRPYTLYVGAASGGLWKTVNNGSTWEPVFDGLPVHSIGDVAVAPSRPDTVWVGTGEANARNSVSWGNGVYRSTDGGKTWQHRGLRETHHVGRVAVHPEDPDTVFVAALGHLWGPNRERGLFRTRDGGATWQQILAPDAETGCVDVAIDPSRPDTVYAAAYRVRRGPFAGGDPAVQFGPEAGLYKSTDGGSTWRRMTAGLPDRPLGRCGLAVAPSDPRVVYAVVQTDKTAATAIPGQPPRTGGDAETGGVFRSADRGLTWEKVNDLCPRPFYFGQVRVDPREPRRVYVLGVALFVSEDGGRTFRNDAARGAHGDHHALWVDPADPDRLVDGGDGGVYFSYDRGRTWEHVNNLPVGQFYAACVDARTPYRVYGGLQDNGTWGGPSRTRQPEGIGNADWRRVFGADGFQCRSDPLDPDTLYCEGQYGMLRRLDLRAGTEADIRPRPAGAAAPAYRFNWNAPLLLSPHDPRTVYYGGNHVFRSTDRGDRWEVIGPDLTYGKPGRSADGGHTLTALAESPLRPGFLWAGSDDGRVHVSRDGGVSWGDPGGNVPGVPPERWVSRIECSPFAEGTAFLALDRHRQDDRAPYLFRTDDLGKTWKPLAQDLPPDGPVYVVRADPRNPDLLYAGTEYGLFLTLDAGRSWLAFRAGLPPAPVLDLAPHPRDRELVVATHGRGLYVIDVAPLEELTPQVRAAPAHLFAVKPARAFPRPAAREAVKGRNFLAPNPPYGAVIYYALRERQPGKVRVVVSDAAGNEVAEVDGPGEPGLHRVVWDLARRQGLSAGRPVPAGDYVARLAGPKGLRAAPQRFRVEADE
jgi:photosystem II stability/assembly factor-like uncharacterized protein